MTAAIPPAELPLSRGERSSPLKWLRTLVPDEMRASSRSPTRYRFCLPAAPPLNASEAALARTSSARFQALLFVA